jgi:Na+-translocating ferredoxin:NAD+ oxidoreductase RnfG subunit
VTMRAGAVAAALALALVAGGCGGSHKPSDKDQIETTLITYYKAFGSGDSATACNQLAKGTIEELERAAGGRDCSEVLDQALKRPDYAKIASKLDGAKVQNVTIAADKATAVIVVPGVAAAGGQGVRTTFPLKKESRSWKIASAIGGR